MKQLRKLTPWAEKANGPLTPKGVSTSESSCASNRRRWMLRSSTAALWATLGAMPSHATDIRISWPFEYTAGRFQIHSDFDLTPNKSVVKEIDQLCKDVASLLSVETTGSTLHIVLFSESTEYRRYIAHYFPTVPNRRALYIQDRGAGMLFAHNHDDLATDLRHESTHALLNDSSKPMALWLDEGLAEYFEVPDRQRMRGHAHLENTMKLLRAGKQPDLVRLESLQDVSDMNGEDYREAWSCVHFLLHRHRETREMLVAHLRAARRSEVAEPVSKALFRKLPDWHSAYRDHFELLAKSIS